MSNNGIVAKLDGNNLVIIVPIEDTPQPSSSGKNLVVASSYGNVRTEVMIKGSPVVIGLNAYIKNPNYKGAA